MKVLRQIKSDEPDDGYRGYHDCGDYIINKCGDGSVKVTVDGVKFDRWIIADGVDSTAEYIS